MTTKEYNKQLELLVKPWLTLFKTNVSQNKLVIRRKVPKLKIVVISAHPDDECLMGSIALRLQKENNAHLHNIAYTLGSDLKNHQRRKKELIQSTKILKMTNHLLPHLEKEKKQVLKNLLREIDPDIIITHHANDAHPTHIRTHQGVIDAVKAIRWKGHLIFADFWNNLNHPNALIELSLPDIQLIYHALTCHKGEIERNPYHLRLIGWLVDNVRRGSELVSNMGAPSPQFPFGQNYMITFFNGKNIKKIALPFSIASLNHDLSDLFS